MAVAFDAQIGTATDTTNTSFSNTTLTIGAISNAVLLVFLSWTSNPGTVTVTWNGVACTLIGSQTTSDGAVSQMYGLINPATGNKTLAVTSTNSVELIMTAGSFSGADQGAVSTTFAHVTSAALSTANPSTVVTSAVGNFTAAMMTTKSGVPSGNKTSFTNFPFSGAGAINADDQRTTGAATVTYAWTHGATAWATMACDIAALGTVGSTPLDWLHPYPDQIAQRTKIDLVASGSMPGKGLN